MSFQEMVAVVDRHTINNITNVVKVRDELEYQWAFNELQATQIIYDMREKGIL